MRSETGLEGKIRQLTFRGKPVGQICEGKALGARGVTSGAVEGGLSLLHHMPRQSNPLGNNLGLPSDHRSVSRTCAVLPTDIVQDWLKDSSQPGLNLAGLPVDVLDNAHNSPR